MTFSYNPKWTKGAWTINMTDPPGFIGVDGASFKIRTPLYATDLDYEDYLHRTADAHLISAAPDVADALVPLIVFALDNLEGLDPETRAEVEADIARARAALMKAVGHG